MDLNNYKSFPDAKIDPGLLWEYEMENFDYLSMSGIVVQRVVERGFPEDWYAALNFYGWDGMKDIVKNLPYLNDTDMSFVSIFFDIPFEELKCYTRKQFRKAHWNS